MKKLRVTVEGKVYEVLVELLDAPDTPAPAAAAPAPRPAVASLAAPVAAAPVTAATATAPVAKGDANSVPSPLAGKVVSIDVQKGQSVPEGAQVATIEAMKMNTYIYAPRAGTIAAIHVTPGDGVEEGAAILSLA